MLTYVAVVATMIVVDSGLVALLRFRPLKALALRRRFGPRHTAAFVGAIWLSYGVTILSVVWGRPLRSGEPDWLTTSAAAAYLVVAAVSVIMIFISWTRRGGHGLVPTLTVNLISALTYVLKATMDLEPIEDAFGRPFEPLRYATWWHTMPCMCVLCGQVFAADVGETLEMISLALACIGCGWVCSDVNFLPAGGVPKYGVVALMFGVSARALALLTSRLHARLVRDGSPALEQQEGPLAEAESSQDRSLRKLAMLIVVSWWAFPCLWLLCAASRSAGRMDEVVYVAVELVAKVLCTLVMMHGSVESFEERDQRLREVEHWRLQEQLRAESMFVSYVFHEMRNPYNGIAGHLSCIEETLRGCTRALERGGGAEGAALASLARSVANMVDDCAAATLCSQHMSDVLNNVLDLRRIEEGAMTLEPAPFDVAALVRDTSRMVCPRDSVLVRQSASEGGRELQAFHCCGDALRLRQVLLNLLGNACKHTARGRIEIVVRVLTEADGVDDDGRRAARRAAAAAPRARALRFEVRDTGPGIDAAHQDRVFAKYFTLGNESAPRAYAYEASDASDRGAGPSTGLGLVVSKHLVELMGSDLRLTSPWDGSSPGTRFHFDVVLEAVADVPRTSSQRALDARAEGERDDDVATALPRTLRCLVADDLAFNRNLLSRYLTRMPPFDALRWDVEECSTGEDILSRVLTHGETYDVFFVDEHFDTAGGVLKGSEVIRRLKAAGPAAPSGGEPIFVTTSGNCLAEDVEFYKSCGADDTFSKPLPNKFELGRRLLKLLKRKRGDADGGGEGAPAKRPRVDAPEPEPPRRSARKRGADDGAGPAANLRKRK